MGLDVYVGSLTRYYAGDWETVVARAAREQGMAFEVVHVDGGRPEGQLTEPAEIAEVVLAWRTRLAAALERPLEWNEDANAPYFTDKPAWDGYGSVQVLAASVERGERKLPEHGVEDWTKNKVWRKATKDKGARFATVYFPELWLPVDLDVTVDADDPGGNRILIGSSEALLRDLQAVNDATYRGSEDDLAAWRRTGADAEGPFDEAARFGLAVFLELAEKSVTERLPMRLDY